MNSCARRWPRSSCRSATRTRKRETRNFKFNEDQVSRLRGKNLAHGVDLTLGPGRDRVSVGILDLVGGSTGYGRVLFAQ
jgi:hypothetical protein